MDGFTPGTYDGTELGPQEGSSEGTTCCLLEFDATYQVLQ